MAFPHYCKNGYKVSSINKKKQTMGEAVLLFFLRPHLDTGTTHTPDKNHVIRVYFSVIRLCGERVYSPIFVKKERYNLLTMKRVINAVMAVALATGAVALAQTLPQQTQPEEKALSPDGNQYVPYESRTGNESIVYFTRDLSAEGLIKAYEQVCADMTGSVGVKLHTGEPNGPNIIPREWIKELIENELPEAHIIETNTYYKGDRYTTEQHRQTLQINGWTFCPVDIIDEEDTLTLPVKGGKWFDKMSVGSHLTRYNSLLTLTHFKGHTQGGFGGSNKNIGIGCADGRIGKAWIHTTPGQDNQWDIAKEEFMERMTESTKSVIDYFGKHVTYINVMRNMSVSCDCEGIHAAPVVTPNVGILSSTDILAIDQACIDLVYAMTEAEHHDLVERIETRHGLRQLSYMKELGMGNDRYVLIDLDNGGKRITAAEAVKGLKPFVQE